AAARRPARRRGRRHSRRSSTTAPSVIRAGRREGAAETPDGAAGMSGAEWSQGEVAAREVSAPRRTLPSPQGDRLRSPQDDRLPAPRRPRRGEGKGAGRPRRVMIASPCPRPPTPHPYPLPAADGGARATDSLGSTGGVLLASVVLAAEA